MGKWHGYLDILSVALKVYLFGCIVTVVGQLLTNEAFASLYVVENTWSLLLGEGFLRIGQFLIAYFPLFVLLRFSLAKNKKYSNVGNALIAYVTFNVFTIFFSANRLNSSAYSSVLGISITNSSISDLANKTNYPLISGLIGALICVVVVRLAASSEKRKRNDGIFGFIDPNFWGMLISFILAIFASFIFSALWPFVYSFIQDVISFISGNISNPINLFVYGIADALASTLSVQSLIRQPFWYSSVGGTISSIGGQTISGDVNIFASIIQENLTASSAGRFITPYYMVNIVVIPVSLIAFYRVNSDKMERRKKLPLVICLGLLSMLGGLYLPYQIFLLLLSPTIYIIFVIMFGLMFGVCSALRISLGFVSNSVVTAIPGNIVEFIIYIANYRYRRTCLYIVLIALVFAVIFYLVITIYFKKMDPSLVSYDLKRCSRLVIKCFGGINNIKFINADLTHITVQVFDNSNLDLYPLKDIGAIKIVEKRSGYCVTLGPRSYLLMKQIQNTISSSIRQVND